jgi:hypothetical protein
LGQRGLGDVLRAEVDDDVRRLARLDTHQRRARHPALGRREVVERERQQ